MLITFPLEKPQKCKFSRSAEKWQHEKPTSCQYYFYSFYQDLFRQINFTSNGKINIIQFLKITIVIKIYNCRNDESK